VVCAGQGGAGGDQVRESDRESCLWALLLMLAAYLIMSGLVGLAQVFLDCR
jgi:hypothetical protein